MNELSRLDAELIKADGMNTEAVQELLEEMATEDMPQPDYEKIRNGLFATKKKPAHSRRYRQLAAIAACAAALVLCITLIPSFIDNHIGGSGSGSGGFWDGIFGTRHQIFGLSDFFIWEEPDAIVHVRVLSTEDRVRKAGSRDIHEQVSTVQILSTIWSSGGYTPDTIRIAQSIRSVTDEWILFDVATGADNTHLLRAGNEYILPIEYLAWLGEWSPMFAEDVLFEVGADGRLQSNSSIRGFSRFDGRRAQSLADAINRLASGEDFHAFNTGFGRSLRFGRVFAEVTVLSVTHHTRVLDEDYSYDYSLHSMKLDNIVSDTRRPRRGDTITAKAAHRSYEPGRYMIILERVDDVFYIGAVARINEDGTIISTDTETEGLYCVFHEFEGFTAAQMIREAERAKAWIARNVR